MKDSKEAEYLELSKLIKQNKLIMMNYKQAYTDEMTQITDKIRKVESEKQELRKQTKILKVASDDTRVTNTNLVKKYLLHKENLWKLKNYCNEMLLPKINRINNSY